jgi:hypothetical protein
MPTLNMVRTSEIPLFLRELPDADEHPQLQRARQKYQEWLERERDRMELTEWVLAVLSVLRDEERAA